MPRLEEIPLSPLSEGSLRPEEAPPSFLEKLVAPVRLGAQETIGQTADAATRRLGLQMSVALGAPPLSRKDFDESGMGELVQADGERFPFVDGEAALATQARFDYEEARLKYVEDLGDSAVWNFVGGAIGNMFGHPLDVALTVSPIGLASVPFRVFKGVKAVKRIQTAATMARQRAAMLARFKQLRVPTTMPAYLGRVAALGAVEGGVTSGAVLGLSQYAMRDYEFADAVLDTLASAVFAPLLGLPTSGLALRYNRGRMDAVNRAEWQVRKYYAAQFSKVTPDAAPLLVGGPKGSVPSLRMRAQAEIVRAKGVDPDASPEASVFRRAYIQHLESRLPLVPDVKATVVEPDGVARVCCFGPEIAGSAGVDRSALGRDDRSAAVRCLVGRRSLWYPYGTAYGGTGVV